MLVVDDEIDMLELARMLLESKGHEVDTATNGALGLAAARATVHDVIVLDITMPDMDGIELGKALRADPSTASTPILIHSGLNETWVRAFFAEYDCFLAKPEQSNQLAASVEELLPDR